MTFPLIEFLLAFIFLMTLRSLWLWFQPNHQKWHFYQKIVIYLNIYIGIHALYVLITESFFPDLHYLDRLPFALLYGPFLCFIILAQKNEKLSKRMIWIHIMPVSLFFLWYVTLLSAGIPNEPYKLYRSALTICSLLSFSSYAIWSIHYVTWRLKDKPLIRKSLLLTGFMLLVLMSAIVLAYILSDGNIGEVDSARILLRSMVYSCMLGSAYLINIELKPINRRTDDKTEHQKRQPSETKYEKSLVPLERLDAYAETLKVLMQRDKVYLNQDLSLQNLAELSNVPSHHLTQVFNVKLKSSFHEYVNKMRIEEACTLLIAQRDTPIEIIAQRCGFNSKSSFNRNFKASLNCSPSEYRSSHL